MTQLASVKSTRSASFVSNTCTFYFRFVIFIRLAVLQYLINHYLIDIYLYDIIWHLLFLIYCDYFIQFEGIILQEIIELFLVTQYVKSLVSGFTCFRETTPPLLDKFTQKHVWIEAETEERPFAALERWWEWLSVCSVRQRMFGKTVYSRRRITVKSACGRLPGFRKLNEKKMIL